MQRTAELSAPARRLPRSALAGAALVAIGLACMSAGATSIGPGEILRVLAAQLGLGAADPAHEAIVLAIRLPRVALGMIHGALLACSGAMLQGLFRNPLADPGLLGTSGGAMMAAAAWTVILAPHLPGAGWWAMPVAAFVGALAATAAVLRIGGAAGRAEPALLLLAGIAVNALSMAATGLLLAVADDAQIRSMTFWSLGSLGGSNGATVLLLAPVIVVAAIASHRLAPELDALLLGVREAGHVGVRVPRLQVALVLVTALAVGSSVAVAGTIGFVGLVVPNLVRMIVGPSHRHLLPLAAIAGAALVVIADAIARVVAAPAELPIGVFTTLVGVPFFLHLLRRRIA